MKPKAVWLALFVLAACSVHPPRQNQMPPAGRQTPASPSPIFSTTPLPATQAPTRNPLPPASSTPAATTTLPASLQACSPLEGIPLADLPGIVANPFVAPRPGYDDGHHGVDLAFYRYQDRVGIEGLGVQAVFGGRIAAAISDRPPYGNMMIVETPLNSLPSPVIVALEPLEAGTPLATPEPRLTCPARTPAPAISGPPWSLYLLYAHMEAAPAFKIGDPVACGQRLGMVGNTGMSGNPHLHLELRLGHSDSTFTAMSHYNNAAMEEEMANYCAWRVSGAFHMIDPLYILK
ncbi:MAG: M23 family metallopeptidase [Chloroflexi bacterium]|nr:M23 family metallopeptidase [Chloroflexota bacterium]